MEKTERICGTCQNFELTSLKNTADLSCAKPSRWRRAWRKNWPGEQNSSGYGISVKLGGWCLQREYEEKV